MFITMCLSPGISVGSFSPRLCDLAYYSTYLWYSLDVLELQVKIDLFWFLALVVCVYVELVLYLQ